MLLLALLACGADPTPADTSDPASTPRHGCLDADGDGFGDPAQCADQVDLPGWYVSDATDCDDLDPDVHPGADEHCDGADEDCDGSIDEDAVDLGVWFLDEDGDGYGDVEVQGCEAPDGAVSVGGDCDDSNASLHPEAVEHCDRADEDCDGAIDEDAVDLGVWYEDGDGDGYGDAEVRACEQPTDTVLVPGDCDDAAPATNPGATEHCDGVDEDCDGAIDEDAVDLGVWYEDGDGDGYGDAEVRACEQPTDTVLVPGDCDDAAPATNPGATEHCDGVDEDCDGAIDEDAVDPGMWFVDGDGDGYGGVEVHACGEPTGTVSVPGDCDDTQPGTNPGATEHCDGVDEDCDGAIDEDAVDPGVWYEDGDGDGYGGVEVQACEQPAGSVYVPGDCDDDEPGTNPGAAEVCGGVDEDCDGAIDEGAAAMGVWYTDADGDGFGAAEVVACEQPTDGASVAGDCDDTKPGTNPGASEHCDGADEDCDGAVDEDAVDPGVWYTDADGDRFGAAEVVACEQPIDGVSVAGDCDDTKPGTNPGTSEHCDGADEDCDGAVDEDAVDPGVWYTDADGDGFGSAPVAACDAPAGSSPVDGDCDDTDVATNPAAAEVCGDGIDQDCDGTDRSRCGPMGTYTLGTSGTRLIGRAGDHWIGTAFDAVGDINGDGVRDVALLASATATVLFASPYRGLASSLDVSFAELDPSDVTGVDDAMAVGDFTGDGVTDLFLPTVEGDDGAVALLFEGPVEGDVARSDAAGLILGGDLLHRAAAVRAVDAETVVLFSSDSVRDGTYGWSETLGIAAVVEGPFAGTVSADDAVATLRPHAFDEHTAYGGDSCVLDLDGDGVYDIVGAASGNEGTFPDPIRGGAVYVVFGPHSGEYILDDADGHLADADAMWGYAGTARRLGNVLSCGDTDGDGSAEIAMGSNPDLGYGPGALWLVPGATVGEHPVDDAEWTVTGADDLDHVGWDAAAEVDLDGDGADEVVVSQVGWPGVDGKVRLFYGGALHGTADPDEADATWEGAELDDCVGHVSPGGDLDLDGWEDLLIGNSCLDESATDAGGVYVIYGGS